MVYLILRKLPKPQKFIFELFGPCNKFNSIKDENNKDTTWKTIRKSDMPPGLKNSNLNGQILMINFSFNEKCFCYLDSKRR